LCHVPHAATEVKHAATEVKQVKHAATEVKQAKQAATEVKRVKHVIVRTKPEGRRRVSEEVSGRCGRCVRGGSCKVRARVLSLEEACHYKPSLSQVACNVRVRVLSLVTALVTV
jgi:hypothetical protein